MPTLDTIDVLDDVVPRNEVFLDVFPWVYIRDLGDEVSTPGLALIIIPDNLVHVAHWCLAVDADAFWLSSIKSLHVLLSHHFFALPLTIVRTNYVCLLSRLWKHSLPPSITILIIF